MTFRLLRICLLIGTLAGFASTIGCGSSSDKPAPQDAKASQDDYNPHDVPITDEQKDALKRETEQFGAAISTVRSLRDTVEAETKDGIPKNPYLAHQALDKADLVLQWLPEIASQSEVPKEHWEQVNVAANTLRTLLEQVHQNIDNRKDPEFASVADGIDRILAELDELSDTAAPAADKQ